MESLSHSMVTVVNKALLHILKLLEHRSSSSYHEKIMFAVTMVMDVNHGWDDDFIIHK